MKKREKNVLINQEKSVVKKQKIKQSSLFLENEIKIFCVECDMFKDCANYEETKINYLCKECYSKKK